MDRGIKIGRGLARSAGQVAVSVVATLIATQIYTALQRGPREKPVRLAASLTDGGKFDARIPGAALPPPLPPPLPPRPLLSMIAWAPTPPAAPSLDAAVWALDTGAARIPEPASRPARHDARRALAGPPPVAKPAPLPQADLHTGAATALASGSTGPLALVVDAAQAVVGLGGSILAISGTALGHLDPWAR